MEPIQQLADEIKQLAGEDMATQRRLLKLLRKIERENKINTFKVERTLKDSKIITNFLNQTIEELEEKNVVLEQKSKIIKEQAQFKERLFANVSHELRTPLNGILGMSYLLLKEELPPKQQEYVSVIKSSADNLVVIVNDILNYSQLSAGKVNIIPQPFYTHQLFADLHGLLCQKAQDKNLWLRFNIPTDLPSYLISDQVRLAQILLNLLNNAIKFTEQGGVTLSVQIVKREDKKLNISFVVEDTGVGMTSHQLENIFSAFTQVHQVRNWTQEGIGLGLNIVKSLVHLMEGEVVVSSVEKKGTTFTVDLPFVIPDEHVIQTFFHESTYTRIPEHWQWKKLLYIEDNKANILYVQNLLKDWSLSIDIALDLQEAEEKLSTQRYDCILSDVQLPDGNSFDYLEELRKNEQAINQKTAIVVLTAGYNEREKERIKHLDIAHYIGKPFPPKTLWKIFHQIFTPYHKKANLPQLEKEQAFFDKTIRKNKHRQLATIQQLNGGAKTSTQHQTHATSLAQDIYVDTDVPDYLAHLRSLLNGKEEDMIEMIDIFLTQIPDTLLHMEECLLQKNWKGMHFETHKIKSNINILGLLELKKHIVLLDKYAYREICLQDIPKLFYAFKQQLAIEILRLERERSKLLVVLGSS